jgi:hypothetical protein
MRIMRLASWRDSAGNPLLKKRLAATGLGLGEKHLAAETLEDFRDGDADVGIKLVGQAGDE